jgi:hypothetical protein
MQPYNLRALLYLNFDKLLLAFLFLVTGIVVVTLVRGNAPQDLVIRFEDAFSAVLGALIALVTGKSGDRGDYGAVIEPPNTK